MKTPRKKAVKQATLDQIEFAEIVAAVGQLGMTEDDLNCICAQFITRTGEEWIPEHTRILRAQIAAQIEQNRKDSQGR